MMKHIVSGFSMVAALFLFHGVTFAQEQKAGDPLYLPPKEYPSDLAPETDPYWKQEKKRYEKTGEDPHENPTESYYEKTVEYKNLSNAAKKHRKHR